MFRVLDLPPSGPPVVREGIEHVTAPPAGTIRWIELTAPDPDALGVLRLFVVIHAFSRGDAEDIQIHEVHAFRSESFLITVHDNPLPSAEEVWQTAARDRAILERGPSWALFRTVIEMLEETEPMVEQITDRLDDVELALIGGDGLVELAPVFRLKRTVVAMRRVLRPLRGALTAMHRRNDPRLAPRTSLHFRDAAERVARLVDMVEEAREVAITVINAHGAFQAQRTNEIVKRLTIFSAIFLPLAFIVGFFGQNFEGLPYESDAWMWLTIASMVLVPAGLLEWFKRNDWL